MEQHLQPVPQPRMVDLEEEWARIRHALMEAEAELAQEQAAINSFRMHCRLKLDVLVDELQALQMEKQACLTQLELLRQAHDLGVALDDDFWETVEQAAVEPEAEEELLLPTDTPRDKAAEKRLYREMARRFHPDLAKTAVEQAYRTSMMTAVNAAYTAGDTQALYDLAGELDPAEMAELADIETPSARKLRQRILRARRRKRRVQQQLQVLHKENTARLYYKAQALDENSEDWWTLVQRELEEAITHRRRDVETLRKQLARVEQQE
ncbi:MAG: hypothetical protein KC415_13165 [Anaerolineales bacterium]|nr:hypothetical protein [Anaerolineales bacterium]MCB8990067.1 hypothetical protein [Ardenticatenaceae bacterium]MCB9005622.1 hypothetical protein [Ardenticatenaceae bacterium]